MTETKETGFDMPSGMMANRRADLVASFLLKYVMDIDDVKDLDKILEEDK